MADELRSDAEGTETSAQAGQSSDQDVTPQQSEEAADSVKQQDTREKDNIRRLQAKKDKEIAAANQKAQAAEQQARQLAMQQQQMNQQLEEMRLRDMDAGERAQYEVQKARQETAYYQQQLQQQQYAQARIHALKGMQQELKELWDVDVPMEVLEEAQEPDKAWMLGQQYVRKNLTAAQEAKAQAEQEKRTNNDVDLGSGRIRTPSSDVDRQLKEARAKEGAIGIARLWLNNR